MIAAPMYFHQHFRFFLFELFYYTLQIIILHLICFFSRCGKKLSHYFHESYKDFYNNGDRNVISTNLYSDANLKNKLVTFDKCVCVRKLNSVFSLHHQSKILVEMLLNIDIIKAMLCLALPALCCLLLVE